MPMIWFEEVPCLLFQVSPETFLIPLIQCLFLSVLKAVQSGSEDRSRDLSSYPPQSGYIDGPILSTFHTNLVVLPAVMEAMQYGFIALGLATILIASLLHHRVTVRPPGCT